MNMRRQLAAAFFLLSSVALAQEPMVKLERATFSMY